MNPCILVYVLSRRHFDEQDSGTESAEDDVDFVATIDASNEKSWKVVFEPALKGPNDNFPSNAALFKVV